MGSLLELRIEFPNHTIDSSSYRNVWIIPSKSHEWMGWINIIYQNDSKWMLDSGMDETGCFNSIYVTRFYVDPLVQKYWDITMKLAGCPRCKPFRHVMLIIPVVSRDQFSVRIPAQLQAWHGRYQRSEWYFFAIEIIELYLQCPWTYISQVTNTQTCMTCKKRISRGAGGQNKGKLGGSFDHPKWSKKPKSVNSGIFSHSFTLYMIHGAILNIMCMYIYIYTLCTYYIYIHNWLCSFTCSTEKIIIIQQDDFY